MSKVSSKAVKAAEPTTATVTATPTVTAEPVAPLSTEEEVVVLPCARKYFFAYCNTAWGHCRDYLAQFFEQSDRFTLEFVDGQLELVKTVKEMPSNSTYVAEANQAHTTLIAQQQQVILLGERLGITIEYVFKDMLVAASEKKQAGLDELTNASPTDWGTFSTFIVTANAYLTAKSAELVAGGMKDTFPNTLKSTGKLFDTAWADFVVKRKAANLATQAVNDGLKQIMVELNPMMALGKSIYKFNPTLRKLFTISHVVAEVRGQHPGGVSGAVRLADTGKPREGVRVELEGDLERFTFTDKQGRYELIAAAGLHNLRFSAPDLLPLLVKQRQVKAGIKGRLNVTMQPVPVEAPAATAQPSLGNQLTSAVSQLMEQRPMMKDGQPT